MERSYPSDVEARYRIATLSIRTSNGAVHSATYAETYPYIPIPLSLPLIYKRITVRRRRRSTHDNGDDNDDKKTKTNKW